MNALVMIENSCSVPTSHYNRIRHPVYLYSYVIADFQLYITLVRSFYLKNPLKDIWSWYIIIKILIIDGVYCRWTVRINVDTSVTNGLIKNSNPFLPQWPVCKYSGRNNRIFGSCVFVCINIRPPPSAPSSKRMNETRIELIFAMDIEILIRPFISMRNSRCTLGNRRKQYVFEFVI